VCCVAVVLLVAGKLLMLLDGETECSSSHCNERERMGIKQVSFSIVLEERRLDVEQCCCL
jgi:hypothetical protein